MGGLRTHPDYAIQSRFVRSLVVVLLLVIIRVPLFAQNDEAGLLPMFNGRDLDGWGGRGTLVDGWEGRAEKVVKRGVIAIQLHRGPPMEVRVRDMRIRELP